MDDQGKIATQAAQDSSETATVTLGTPIKRGDTEIGTLTLRKPTGGDLRGLKLNDILQSDIASLARLVPRIAAPPIVEADFDNMPADDVAEIGGTVFGFFMSAQQKEAIRRLTGEG